MLVLRWGCWLVSAHRVLVFSLVCSLFLLTGCSLGRMTIDQVFYLAVPSADGDDVNYYRITVNAHTLLAKSDYRSGWYPAEAVDSVFGDVSESGSIEQLKTQEALKKSINDKVLATTQAYLDAAADPNTDPARLQKLLMAQQNILAVPLAEALQLENAIAMEYNPKQGLVTAHAGEKLVFVLSADPDEVIANISNFAEHQRTGLAVSKLADVISQRVAGEVAELEANNSASKRTDVLVHQQIGAALSAVDAAREDPKKSAQLLEELEALRYLVEVLE